MGVKTKVSIDDLKPFLSVNSLIESSDGISHSVYFCDDKYILKIYESQNNHFNIDDEINLLNLCQNLKVPKVIKKLKIKDKEAIVFSKAYGCSLSDVENKHLEQIGIFLRDFHTLTKNKSFDSKQTFSKEYLQTLINKTKNSEFQRLFDEIDINLKNDGIIHGDLFVDNAFFQDDELSCVFDFADACNGDFLFDLAVVALSWCSSKEEIKTLINSYDKTIDFDVFINYLKYASLYYCVTRFIANKDFDNISFYKKFKDLI